MQKNQWQGWQCSAGLRSMYIDFDGNIFVGTCEVGGWYGNVFREGIQPEKNLASWVTCTRTNCACSADMRSPKVKSRDLIPDDIQKFLPWASRENTIDEVVAPDAVVSLTGLVYKTIIWDLGRRCNYSCSYCYPGSHNKYESHKSLGSLIHAYDLLNEQWLRGERAFVLIAGGEPTINPNYLEFVQHILSRNEESLVHTTTNGSRDSRFYAELFAMSSLSFSAHLEILSDEHAFERFVKNVETCVELKVRGEIPEHRVLQARIMLKPGMLDLATRLYLRLRDIPGALTHADLSCDILHQSSAKSTLPEYSKEELEFVRERTAIARS